MSTTTKMEHIVTLKKVLMIKEDGTQVDVCSINIIYSTIEQKQRALYVFNRKQKLEYQKKYIEENYDKYIDYQKEYYNRRKKEIIAEKTKKIVCQCGRTLSAGNMRHHLTTALHKKHLELKQSNISCK
jgi:predicted N-acyltransferase